MSTVIPQIKKTQSVYKKDGWRITAQKYNGAQWSYIVHDCENDPESATTRCIVLQAPLSILSHSDYIKQMKCQMCKTHPPDCVITVWTFLNWEHLEE